MCCEAELRGDTVPSGSSRELGTEVLARGTRTIVNGIESLVCDSFLEAALSSRATPPNNLSSPTWTEGPFGSWAEWATVPANSSTFNLSPVKIRTELWPTTPFRSV